MQQDDYFDDEIVRVYLDSIKREELKLLHNFCIDYGFELDIEGIHRGIRLEFTSKAK